MLYNRSKNETSETDTIKNLVIGLVILCVIQFTCYCVCEYIDKKDK